MLNPTGLIRKNLLTMCKLRLHLVLQVINVFISRVLFFPSYGHNTKIFTHLVPVTIPYFPYSFSASGETYYAWIAGFSARKPSGHRGEISTRLVFSCILEIQQMCVGY